jgi:hypothetical protein
MRRKLTVASAASVALLVVATAITAAPRRTQIARSVYAAFSLVSKNRPTTTRCGSYAVTRTTLEGVATSPEPSLGGRARMIAKVALNRSTGYGFITGTLVIRSGRTVRLRATLRGVISNSTVANGLVVGTFADRTALLANVSLIFNENFSFVAVRLGIETGQNSAVAYPVGRRCP